MVGALLGNIDRNTRSTFPAPTTVQAVDTSRFSVISTTIEVVPN
jgi:hypothetical protein